jgi:CheY-like chemotaxis protein
MGKVREIWVIDDDLIFQKIISIQILSVMPEAKISIFENAELAIESLKNNPNPPQTILLDLNMPVMDGWQFLEQLPKDALVDSRIYIVSSSIDPKDLDKSKMFEKVKGYLIKPVQKQTLTEVLSD